MGYWIFHLGLGCNSLLSLEEQPSVWCLKASGGGAISRVRNALQEPLRTEIHRAFLFFSNHFNLFQQVSTSAVAEEKEVPVVNIAENSKLSSLESPSHRIITVHYVLEESSGYMEPTLRILAILHTVISFFCIIGYYCLKVRGQGIHTFPLK